MDRSRQKAFSLAIEMTSRSSSVALGCEDQFLESRQLPEPRRHSTDLMATIDALCLRHGARVPALGQIFVSIGPGSFTGLRIAITTANILGRITGAQLLGVPTVDVVAQNAPPMPNGVEHVAVCLNLKRQTMWAGLFDWDGIRFAARQPPSLLTLQEVLHQAPRPLAILGHPLPDSPELDSDVSVLPTELAIARSDIVWQLGRTLSQHQDFAEPGALRPLYVRPPEAQELWNQRHAR